jgi:predicted signal transduction protein with EAL and GGDEF domain
VAEGVESAAALRWLVQAGCNQAQGYYIARPMTAAALDEWIVARRTQKTPPDRSGKVAVPFIAAIGGAGC